MDAVNYSSPKYPTTKPNKGNQMKKTIQISDLIFTKIKHRYHFMSEGRLYERNIHRKILIDSFYPAEIARQIADPKNERRYGKMTHKKGYAISQRVANDLGCKQLHISELVTMLGYTKTDISKLLQAVKHKSLNLTLCGLGGTGSNVLHWMYEMSQWTGKDQIFDKIYMFDDDDFDIPNMLRIPFMPQFSSENFDAKKANTIPGKFDILANKTYRHTEKLNASFLNRRGNGYLGNPNKVVIYGAPDIATREFLSGLGYTFLAATHRDNEYSIVENPSVDNDLMMETYGKINLSMFFLNHLSMTIDFLTHLATREEPLGSIRQNRAVVRENFGDKFQQEIASGFKAGAKKLYAIKESRAETTIELEEEL